MIGQVAKTLFVDVPLFVIKNPMTSAVIYMWATGRINPAPILLYLLV